jgi:exodeoxyribonuclease VII small subunit
VPSSTKHTEAPAAEKQPPFEEALRKLEDIVESMESGELPLESLLARFEEGTRLVKACQSRLEEAELTINKLEKNRAGEFTLQPVAEVSEP